jgi:hypothetical protein
MKLNKLFEEILQENYDKMDASSFEDLYRETLQHLEKAV